MGLLLAKDEVSAAKGFLMNKMSTETLARIVE
jgi:hypothetical protein